MVLTVVATNARTLTAMQPVPWSFNVFVAEVEPRLRRALVAAYGREIGTEATAEALAWAWEHTGQLESLAQPVGYLYRVGQSRVRRRRIPFLRPTMEWTEPWFEPALAVALSRLSQRQRVAAVLVLGFDWTQVKVAELLGVTTSTVQTHLQRAVRRLQEALEVNHGE
jgi:RNA polymerase sigma factor (sigma-70 family)